MSRVLNTYKWQGSMMKEKNQEIGVSHGTPKKMVVSTSNTEPSSPYASPFANALSDKLNGVQRRIVYTGRDIWSLGDHLRELALSPSVRNLQCIVNYVEVPELRPWDTVAKTTPESPKQESIGSPTSQGSWSSLCKDSEQIYKDSLMLLSKEESMQQLMNSPIYLSNIQEERKLYSTDSSRNSLWLSDLKKEKYTSYGERQEQGKHEAYMKGMGWRASTGCVYKKDANGGTDTQARKMLYSTTIMDNSPIRDSYISLIDTPNDCQIRDPLLLTAIRESILHPITPGSNGTQISLDAKLERELFVEGLQVLQSLGEQKP